MNLNQQLKAHRVSLEPQVDNYKKVMRALSNGEDVDYTPGFDDGEGPVLDHYMPYKERLEMRTGKRFIESNKSEVF